MARCFLFVLANFALALVAFGEADVRGTGPAGIVAAIVGDADCSGGVTAGDALPVLTVASGTRSGCADRRADVNCDGSVGIPDAYAILRFAAGLTAQDIQECPSLGQAVELSAEERIDTDAALGVIDEGTAILYKAYWAFGDPRLPPKYASSTENPGDVPDDVFVRPTGLSSEVEEALDAFLAPPSSPGSWYATLHGANAAVGSVGGSPLVTPVDPGDEWKPVVSQSGRVTVWWDSANGLAGDEQVAEELATVVEGIWTTYEALLGATPPSDAGAPPAVNGGGGSYDIYLAPLEPSLYGYVSTFEKLYKETAPCPARPTFMVVNTAKTIQQLRVTLAHELFHSFQRAFSSFDPCGEYSRFLEASAAWAQDYAYPNSNLEHSFTGFTQLASVTWPGWDPMGYSGFIFLLYLTRTHGPAVIGEVFTLLDEMTIPEAIDEAVPGGLNAAWKEFALFGWNSAPFDYFKQWDNIPFQPRVRAVRSFPPEYLSLSTDESEAEIREAIASPTTSVQPLAIQYLFFATGLVGSDVEEPAWVRFNNPLFGNMAESHALQLLYRVAGQQQWQYEDLTDKAHVEFCRETPSERVTQAVLIVSNADPDEISATFFGEPIVTMRDSCACPVSTQQSGIASLPCRFTGTAKYTSTFEENGPGGVERIDETSEGTGLVFSRRAAPEPSDDIVYDIVSGTLTHEWRYEYGNDEISCVEVGNASVPLEPGEAHITLSEAGGGEYEYSASGGVNRDVVHVTAMCEGDEDYEYDTGVAWFSTRGTRPAPANFVLQGEDESSVAGATQISTWNFTPQD